MLTTYETLRSDLHHAPSVCQAEADSGPGRASRHRKKYEIIPTPLTRLTWWRVVLDEAQEVESSTAAAAAMARLVPGVHRWAVTGTPVSRGLEDLQGLFAFLGAPSPFTDAHWWRRVVEVPFEKGHAETAERFLDVLRRVMWRNARADVADELRLPPQSQTVTAMRPSGIEAHWYRKQREVCERAAREALRRVVDPARARAETAAARVRNRDGPVASTAGAYDAEAFAPGSGRRLGARSDRRRDDGTADDVAAPTDEDEDEDEDDAMFRDVAPAGETDETSAVDLTVNTHCGDAAESLDRRLTADESRRVLLPLLRLRQACNHPQAGAHGVRGLVKGGAAREIHGTHANANASIGLGGIHSGAIMSMPQIHAILIEKQRVEAEEAQRLVAFTLNASAGVACCEKRFGAAVEHYRQVLKLEASGAAVRFGVDVEDGDALRKAAKAWWAAGNDPEARAANERGGGGGGGGAEPGAPSGAGPGGCFKGFARVVWNFPDAGVGVVGRLAVQANQDLLDAFFRAAKPLLSKDGEVHVAMRACEHRARWNVAGVAARAGYAHRASLAFAPADFPGYEHFRTLGEAFDANGDETSDGHAAPADDDVAAGAQTLIFQAEEKPETAQGGAAEERETGAAADSEARASSTKPSPPGKRLAPLGAPVKSTTKATKISKVQPEIEMA